jgi:YYY domain-containing protein
MQVEEKGSVRDIAKMVLPIIILVMILCIGAYLRFIGLNWDENSHPHPDERFLTMVETALRIPSSVGEYFNTKESPLNPHNVGYTFFVYGTFPIFIVRFIAEWVGKTGYDQVQLVGRAAAASFDLISILLVYMIGSRLYKKRVGLLAAAFTAFSVLLIQHSHFFVVDSFANTFILMGIYFAVRVLDYGRLWDYALFGVALGMSVASKISAVPLAVIVVIAAIPRLCRILLGEHWEEEGRGIIDVIRDIFFALYLLITAPSEYLSFEGKEVRRRTLELLIGLVLAAMVSLITFRILQPYAFKGPTIFGVGLNDRWLENMAEIRRQQAGDADFPPALQWAMRTPIFFALQNIVLWGMGVPLGVLSWVAFIWALARIFRKRETRHTILVLWTGVIFLWQSTQFTPAMRYQLPIYPTLNLLAAWGIWKAWDLVSTHVHDLRRRVGKILIGCVTIGVLTSTALWAFAFVNIYQEPMTQVAASRWIYKHIPGAMNFVLNSEEGEFYEPGALPSSFAIIPGSSSMLELTYKPDSPGVLKSITLSGLDTSTILETPLFLQVTVIDVNNDHNPVGIADFEGLPTSSEIELNFGTDLDVLLEPDVEYLVRLEMVQGEKIVIRDPIQLTLSWQGSESIDYLSLPPVYTLVEGDPSLVNIQSQINGQAHALFFPYASILAEEGEDLLLEIEIFEVAQLNRPLVTTSYYQVSAGMQEIGIQIRFEQPLQLEEGTTYQVRLNLVEGEAIRLRGSMIIHETTWDLALPMRIDGRDGFGGLYHGINQEMYWPDDQDDDFNDTPDKLERIVETLSEGDYLVLSTNRQYGTITRVPARYPLSTEYYRKLFGCAVPQSVASCASDAQPEQIQGELGFELEAIFQSNPKLGPFEINDQAAEEAFTVYDHPKVLIFKKGSDYSEALVYDLLGQVDVSQVDNSPPGELGSIPSNIMLPPDRLAAQRSGGTWSDYFNWESWINRFPFLTVLVWWIAIGLLGIIAFPLTRVAFKSLHSGGYALARIVGLLFVAWLTWFLSSFEIHFEKPLILAVLFILLIISSLLAWRDREELKTFLKEKKKEILWIEVLALALFLLDLGIRLGNPDLWHPFKGGEKPMNFSYLNAVIKSTSFPPYDPWFAGGYINYYYFGYVIVGVPIKLLGIVPSIAYNLVIPTIFALLGLSAFSIGYNLFYRFRSGSVQIWRVDPRVVGVIAAVAIVILGNLGSARLIYEGFRELGGWPGEEQAAFASGITYAARGVAEYLTGDQGFPVRTDQWYWDASRAIEPGPGEAGPITEFPFFTFLYADLHAHMIDLPITVAALAWGLSWLLGARDKKRLGIVNGGIALFIGAMILGALRPTNTWDFPTYWALSGIVVIAAAWLRQDPSNPSDSQTSLHRLGEMIFVGLILFGLAQFLYQPYHQWYKLGYDKPLLWKGSQTKLDDYLVVHGFFLFLILSWMLWEVRQWMARTPLSALNRYRKPILFIILSVIFGFIGVVILACSGMQIAPLTYAILALSGVLFLWAGLPLEKRAVLFLVGTGTALTIFVELVVLEGDISRMNTVFKFYLQVWTLFGLSAVAGLAWIWSDFRQWTRNWRTAWMLILFVLVFMAALYPFTATQAKISDRIAQEAPHSLDGMAYMPYSTYHDIAGPMDLAEDYEAILWMQENIEGSPVIVEANTPEYRWGSRYTIYTGLPGVLGWNWHQRQQRGFGGDNSVMERAFDIASFYANPSIEEAWDFIQEFDVSYIVVGQLEKQYYEALDRCVPSLEGKDVTCDMAGRPVGMPQPDVDISECQLMDEDTDPGLYTCPTYGLTKFEDIRDLGLVEVAFETGETVIYKVNR